MEKIRGTGVSNGIAAGPLTLRRREPDVVTKTLTDDPEAEIARLTKARETAERDLNQIYLKSLKKVGEKESMIFQIHLMMLQDQDFSKAMEDKIRSDHVSAEYAAWKTGSEFAKQFDNMDNEYMRARKADVVDISRRLIHCLTGGENGSAEESGRPSILAAEDLTPSETMQMDRSKILAIITRGGSRTSHSAILARTMGIPSIVGLKDNFDHLKAGMNVIVDGTTGEVILEPDEAAKTEFAGKAVAEKKRREELNHLLSTVLTAPNGHKIAVNANIGHPQDVEGALENGADGIGLFRSEFLYMERDSLPTEEEQFEAYKKVLVGMNGKSVIVRTFDIGADKQVSYLNLPKEANPALGYRAIRICLDRRDLFRTQLRALMRASVYGKLKIMFPMIISVNEVRTAKAELEKVKDELSVEKIPFAPDVEVGIMIETPASVVMSEELAKECSFFSVGTNDLTQYTLAVDRMNGNISKLYNQANPAVLKMIAVAARNAHKAGIPIGICGESAADTKLTDFYLREEIDELSVASSSVLSVKESLMKTLNITPGK